MNEKILVALNEFEKELNTLSKAVNKAKDLSKNNDLFEYLRDSVIQRFEYTSEWAWKLVKIILKELHWIECYWPKDSLKAWFESWYLLHDLNDWFDILKTRNITSHTYGLDSAEMLYGKILQHYEILLSFLGNIKQKIWTTK